METKQLVPVLSLLAKTMYMYMYCAVYLCLLIYCRFIEIM